MKDTRPFPFRWVLPLAQLVFCIGMMWPIWHYLGVRVLEHRKPNMEAPFTPPEKIDLTVMPELTPEMLQQIDRREIRYDLPAFFNLPAGFLQIPYAAYSSEKQDWVPKNIDPVISDLFIWRGLTWPFLGILFWWMVGRSIEALVALRTKVIKPRIRWIEAICGLTIWFLSGGLFIVNLIPNTMDDKTSMVLISSGLWTVLGALIVVTCIIQWRMRRRTKGRLVENPHLPFDSATN